MSHKFLLLEIALLILIVSVYGGYYEHEEAYTPKYGCNHAPREVHYHSVYNYGVHQNTRHPPNYHHHEHGRMQSYRHAPVAQVYGGNHHALTCKGPGSSRQSITRTITRCYHEFRNLNLLYSGFFQCSFLSNHFQKIDVIQKIENIRFNVRFFKNRKERKNVNFFVF